MEITSTISNVTTYVGTKMMATRRMLVNGRKEGQAGYRYTSILSPDEEHEIEQSRKDKDHTNGKKRHTVQHNR